MKKKIVINFVNLYHRDRKYIRMVTNIFPTHKSTIILFILLIFCGVLLFSYTDIFKGFISSESEINLRDPTRPYSNVYHDKWIVITSINPPTEDVKKLSRLKGWKLLLVGDTKSPANWSYPNCIFLNVEQQLRLGYQTTKLIKFKSYARKNIGYLFAIEHGAKLIYDTDDDNSPTTANIGFDPSSDLVYLSYYAPERTSANPYAHFGQSTVWPRGYPLDKIADKPLIKYRQCEKQNVLVQQGVVNGDPDVDAIYRLTRKDSNVDLKINFDSEADPLMYPKGLMAPYNSQNTFHLYNAFWGLLLPQTVAFRVCDIWRGYWAQRLLWDIGGHIGFFPPNAYTYRNAHSFLEDFIDERELYHESSYLVDFLTLWKSKEKSFFKRIIELTEEMKDRGFWEEDDVTLVKYWLKDLKAIGYKPPKIKKDKGRKHCNKNIIERLPNEQPSAYLGLQTQIKDIVSDIKNKKN